MRLIIPGHLILLWTLLPIVLAFSFTPSTLTQCDDMSIQWTGGTPPFQLHIIPQYGVPRNVSIPPSSFNNGQGSFSTQLQLAQNKKLLLTMSDATGFGSGGTTEVLTVGASQGGSCDTSDPKLDFTFALDGALQQCRPYVFGGYSSASQPVRIIGVIPGGESFVLRPPTGPTSYTWPAANMYNGTSVIFLMVDSLSRQGGSSDLYTVLATGDASCINGTSPSSTVSPTSTTSPSSTTSSGPSATTTAAAATGGTPIAVIAATVIGSLIFLAVSITLGLFFLKKYRDRKRPWSPNGFRPDSVRIQSQTNLDLAGESSNLSSPYHYSSHTTYTANASANPLFSPFPQSDSQSLSPMPYAPSSHLTADPFSPIDTMTEPDPFTAHDSSRTSMSTAQRKAAMAGATSYKPSRFILHTDIEDTVPPDTDEEVVELPPQYSERRNAPGPSTVSQQPPYKPCL